MDRAASDGAYPIKQALAEVLCPVVMLTGTHDAVVNTRAARDILASHGKNVLQVVSLGAGHHVHLLQYSYFRYVLDCFLSRVEPKRTMRLHVERLV